MYGYSHMTGGYHGGQAEYVMVPYADWNLLKFPDKDRAMEKIRDLTMLSDIFPTGFHGAYTAGVPVVPVSVAYSLMSEDHSKLKHIFTEIRPRIVYAAIWESGRGPYFMSSGGDSISTCGLADFFRCGIVALEVR